MSDAWVVGGKHSGGCVRFGTGVCSFVMREKEARGPCANGVAWPPCIVGTQGPTPTARRVAGVKMETWLIKAGDSAPCSLLSSTVRPRCADRRREITPHDSLSALFYHTRTHVTRAEVVVSCIYISTRLCPLQPFQKFITFTFSLTTLG